MRRFITWQTTARPMLITCFFMFAGCGERGEIQLLGARSSVSVETEAFNPEVPSGVELTSYQQVPAQSTKELTQEESPKETPAKVLTAESDDPVECFKRFVKAFNANEKATALKLATSESREIIDKMFSKTPEDDITGLWKGQYSKEFGDIALLITTTKGKGYDDGFKVEPILLERIDGQWRLMLVRGQALKKLVGSDEKRKSLDLANQWYIANRKTIKPKLIASNAVGVAEKQKGSIPIVLPKGCIQVVGSATLLAGRQKMLFKSEGQGLEIELSKDKTVRVKELRESGAEHTEHVGRYSDSKGGTLVFKFDRSEFKLPAMSTYFSDKHVILAPSRSAEGYTRQSSYKDDQDSARGKQWIFTGALPWAKKKPLPKKN